jgi:phosphoglycolate phosphatase
MKPKNIILNWAGVITNDFDTNYEAVMIVMKSMLGKTISKEEFKKEFVLPVIDFWHKYDKNIDFEKNKELYAKAIHQVTPPVLYEGIKETLEELHKQKIKLFVISSVPKEKLMQEAKEFGIDKYFKEINGGIYDKSSELKELMQRNNLDNKETAFVSHMLGDINIAKDAGLITIAPTYGNYVSKEDIEKNNPDLIIEDFSELKFDKIKNLFFSK